MYYPQVDGCHFVYSCIEVVVGVILTIYLCIILRWMCVILFIVLVGVILTVV